MTASSSATTVVASAGEVCASADTSPSTQVSPSVELVVKRLLAAHEAWFDVERDAQVAGRRFAGHAIFAEHGEKYVLSRRAKLWEIDTGEHILFRSLSHLTSQIVAEDVAFMKGAALAELVHPAPNHMSTNIALVWVCDEADPEALREVRRTRFRKNHRFGIWGWTDLRLAVIQLAANGRDALVTNGAGKQLRSTLEANMNVSSSLDR